MNFFHGQSLQIHNFNKLFDTIIAVCGDKMFPSDPDFGFQHRAHKLNDIGRTQNELGNY